MTAEWLTRPQNPWILVLIAGVVSTILGILVIFHPWEGLQALIFLVGICFMISGIANVLEHDEKLPRGVTVASGVIWLLTGAIILAWPDETLMVLAIVAGVGLILRGLLRAAVAMNRQVLHRKYYVVMGAVNLVLGIVVIAWPEATLTIVALLIGINVLVAGILEIALAFELRSVGKFI